MKTKELVLISLCSAIVFVCTSIIRFQLPISISSAGLIHIGNIAVTIISLNFNKRVSAFSSAIGMTLFDITSGYFIWAPFTFVIRYFMGHTISTVSKNENILYKDILAVSFGVIIMVGGYFIAGIILVGLPAAISGLAGDLVQVVIAFLGIVLSKVLAPYIKKFA